MLEQPASREKFERLVRTAMRVRAASPWRRIADDQFFGVCDPRTEALSLVGVSGRAGGTKGIQMYPGESGYRTLVRATHGLLPEERLEALREMHSLACSYVPWSRLTADERRFLKDAGMSLTVDADVPRFACFHPGYLPSQPDAEDAECLTLALEQVMAVADELGSDRSYLSEVRPGTFRTRLPVTLDDGVKWVWDRVRMDEVKAPTPVSWTPDEVTATRLRRLPLDPNQDWEVGAVAGAGVLREPANARPEILLTLMIVQRGSGRVLSAEAMRATSYAAEVGRTFADRVLKLGHCPHRVLVREYELRELLAPIARSLASKLLRVQHLPALDEASEAMREHFSHGPRG